MLPKRLSHRRKQLKLSQEDMADKLGITRQGYGHYETGRNQPDNETLIKIAQILDCSTDYLLGITDDPTKESTQDSLKEINKLIKEYGIERIGFFDIEEWKNLSKEDIDEIRRHFEWVKQKAKERNNEEDI
ncbi:transcriptional regulator [Heyndrickxia ginsengihumi]|uniref:Transcriptional regulator n=1 Tax=Heyndrickxia ginsengihumi TaxID=363870 RepID=A0A0A6VDK8_9BACI|nr:helix-turn-helix domain-containing protein [Heyndrickxia ginsengihumi]KHD85661.1 transcriptional regulator [Heyndrickxia ginsengihumi]